MPGDILDLIDGALSDWSASDDAMRWRPGGSGEDDEVIAGAREIFNGRSESGPIYQDTRSLPMIDASQVQTGVMLVQHTDGGYEATVYRLPARANGYVPITSCELVGRGLYDENGTLIREL